LLATLTSAGIDIEKVEDAELEKLADTRQPQGIIAVVRAPRWAVKDIKVKMGPVLVLDGVQDPGNTGAILRTALGLGAAGIIALPGTVEVTNPKVLRGSMGAVFRLPWVTLTVEELLSWAKAQKISLLTAAVDGEPIHSVNVTLPVAIMLGNEGAGLSPSLGKTGRPVSIPIHQGIESLNVAVAAAILLYEVTRVRSTTDRDVLRGHRCRHWQLSQCLHPAVAGRAIRGEPAFPLSEVRQRRSLVRQYSHPVLADPSRPLPHLRESDLDPVSDHRAGHGPYLGLDGPAVRE
jgi:TrmH family RNA methyltransferase